MEGFGRPVPRHRAPLSRRLLADPSILRRWTLVAVLAIAAAALTSSVLGAADDARARWDDTQPVVVATASIRRGEPVAEAVRVAEWPIALAPEGVFSSVADLGDDALAAGPLAAGAPLTEAGVSRPGATDGMRRVALPHGLAPLPVGPGDRVDVWATYDPSLAGAGLQTRRVAVAAEVVTADDQVVVVAVDPAQAADLTEAVALATLTLVGVG